MTEVSAVYVIGLAGFVIVAGFVVYVILIGFKRKPGDFDDDDL